MKIGIYASIIASERGHEKNVSGHIQLPVHTARLLQDAGHEVHLITNRFGDNLTLPAMMPGDVNLHTVDDGRKRPKKLRGEVSTNRRIRPGLLFKQVRQIKRIARTQWLDVLHMFGHIGTLQLGGLLRLSGLRIPIVSTLVGTTDSALETLMSRLLCHRTAAIITSTQYVADTGKRHGLDCHVIRQGVIRDFLTEGGGQPTGPRHRVLYWRDPTKENGVDVCLNAFEAVAPQFPEVSFDLAVRPAADEMPGIDDAAARHENIHVHRFPYPPGTTLAKLINESLIVVLPFRGTSIDPQLAIAESLAAGVPVVTTAIRSNPELVQDRETGWLTPPDESQPIVEALSEMLSDRQRLDKMQRQTAARFSGVWNWNSYVDDLLKVYRSVTG